MQLPGEDRLVTDLQQWLHNLGIRGEHGHAMASDIADYVLTGANLNVTNGLSPSDKADARAIFEGKIDGRGACHYCAGIHAHVAGLDPAHQPCPRVKRWRRHEGGSGDVLEVEFWPSTEAWESSVVFPVDVYDGGSNDSEEE